VKTVLKNISTSIFIATHSSYDMDSNQLSKCPSMGEWTKKMWYTYTMEYFSAIGKNGVPSFVSTWMNLEDITFSEISEAQK
jgi:hypothetical protein